MYPPFLKEILTILLLSGSSTDIVSLLEPQISLECLGQATDAVSLEKLLEGAAAAPGSDAEPSYDKDAARTAIQNLASSSEAVRDSARKRLVGMGPAVRERLEQVAEEDPRRAEAAREVLEQLGDSESSTVHRTAVTRLLAVRLAGDRGLMRLKPAIEKLQESTDPFLRQAAREVLARLEGKDAPSPADRPWLSSLAALEALPTETRVILDARIGASDKIPSTRVDRFLEQVMTRLGAIGAPLAEALPGFVKSVCQQGVHLALTYGNARIDRISLVNVGRVGLMGAGIGIILSGEYQRPIFEQGLESNKSFWTMQEIEGRKVFTSTFVRLVPLDDHNVLVLPQQASVLFPLADYLKSFRENRKPLRSHKRWDKFLGTLDGTALIRGLAITDEVLAGKLHEQLESESVPAEIREAVKAMQEVEAEVRLMEGENLVYRTEAAFESTEHAVALVDSLKGDIEEGIRSMEEMRTTLAGTPLEPTVQKSIDVLRKILVVAEGRKGILRGELSLHDALECLLAPLLFAGT